MFQAFRVFPAFQTSVFQTIKTGTTKSHEITRTKKIISNFKKRAHATVMFEPFLNAARSCTQGCVRSRRPVLPNGYIPRRPKTNREKSCARPQLIPSAIAEDRECPVETGRLGKCRERKRQYKAKAKRDAACNPRPVTGKRRKRFDPGFFYHWRPPANRFKKARKLSGDVCGLIESIRFFASRGEKIKRRGIWNPAFRYVSLLQRNI